VSNNQFNSPLDMYSNENVVEALSGQTGGHVADVVGLPKKDKDNKSDFTQSAVYKMIHGIDQPKPKPVIARAELQRQHSSTPPRQPSTDDETRFRGLNSGTASDVPSRTFQRLQSWTGTTGGGQSEIDTTSIRRNVTGSTDGLDSEEPGQYDEKSIRYTGRNIPSRSFKILQQMTGGPVASDAIPPAADDERRGLRSRSETPKRVVISHQPHHPAPHPHTQHQQSYQPQHPNPADQYQQPPLSVGGSEIDTSSIRTHLFAATGSSSAASDDGQEPGQYDEKSIRYTGRSIPSRSFRMLQQMTGADPGTPPVVQQAARPARQHQLRARPQPQQQGDDSQHDQAGDDARKDVRYVGGSIPSHTFKILQQQIGVDGNDPSLSQPAPPPGGDAVNGGADTLESSGGRRVKVTRLRSQTSTEDTGATEF
jgi:hypothetical protein